MTRFLASPGTWLFWVLVLVVALAPLHLGGNRPLPAAMIALAAGLLLLSWAAITLWRGSINTDQALARRLKWPGVLFGLVALWIIIQWAPLGFAGHPLWQVTGDALGLDLPGRITIHPDATLAALSSLLGYGAVFWLSLELGADATRARQARNAAIAIGGVYALYGLVSFFAGNGLIPAYFGSGRMNALTSTFVNRNSYATFAGLALLCAASLFIERVRHIFSIGRPLRQKIALAVETLTYRGRWVTAAFLIIALALLLTASRGGIISSLTALFALVLLQARTRTGGSGRRGAVAVLTLILMGTTLVIAGGNFLERIDRQGLSVENGLRATIFATTLEAIETAPLAGTGYGTYADAIEAYRPPGSNIFIRWERAHNTYLENALELGIPAASALAIAIFWLAVICFNGVKIRRRNRAYPALGVSATLLVGIHSLVDFSLQMPATAVFYAFIMGIAVAQSVRPSSRRRDSNADNEASAPPPDIAPQ